MASADPWSHLGLPPGSPLAEVRRAYARLLKSIDQQADPDAFRALRAAFEAASGRTGPRLVTLATDRMSLSPTITPAQQILELCRSGTLVEAARLFDAAVRANRLSFEEEEALSVRIARALEGSDVRDQPALEEISALLGWEKTSWQNGADPTIIRLIATRDAGRWLAELEQAAAMPFRLNPGWAGRRRAARRVRKPAPSRLARMLGYFDSSRGLDYWAEGIERHRGILDDRLDPGRLDWCTRQVRLRRSRTLPRIAGIAALLLGLVFLVEFLAFVITEVFLG